MGLPVHQLYPPFNIVRLSHIALQVTDLAASRAFYADILGLQVTEETAERVMFRAMEERGHHCVILEKAAKASASVLGFKVYAEADLDAADVWFRARGLPTRWIERPYQGRTLLTADPFGIPLEFYASMEKLPPIHQKYALYRGVKPLRIDHFNVFSSDVDAQVAFYAEIGFRVTEYTEDAESGRLWAAWMHRKGGVHDMAFTNGRGPRLHHVAFWVPTPLNIIDLLDLMSTSGYLANIERGPGGTGFRMRFSSMSAIRTAIASRFIARTTRRWTPISSRSNGTSRTRSARPSGVRQRRKAGLRKVPAFWVWRKTSRR